MALGINTNVASLSAQNNLSKSQSLSDQALERLSSGLRINSAKDDAAGLAISSRFDTQVRGLGVAQRNANDGISLAQTAEGALGQAGDLLQRIRELSVQSANDTNSASDRKSLQAEVTQLQAELNRVADTTNFNGQTLLNGDFANAQFQVGANANQTINVSLSSARGTDIGNYTADSGGSILGSAITAANDASAGNAVQADTLTISGNGQSENVAVGVGASAADIATNVNAVTGNTGVTANATTTATLSGIGDGTVSFDLTADDGTTVSVAATVGGGDLGTLAAAINDASATTGVTAVVDGATITLENKVGSNIAIENFTTDNGTNTTMSVDGPDAAAAVDLTSGGTDSTLVTGTIEFSSSSAFSVQAAAQTEIVDAAKGGSLQSVAAIDITTTEGANKAIETIDAALSTINSQRADLGAIQNRFTSTIDAIATTSENLSAAQSRILDADFASETAKLAKSQVLQQAGISVLAQANARPQQVLSLLQ
ncbi:flagellin [Marinobacter sp. BGYM27]|uniref:flagellin N-terminal helical domain-containing protein n=1 Tax=Marinobacter sp. BGYM27 TaxID=2975597 RepID=UPI00243446BF|nr:flagellin [Marinobacter sp. BGYM27]MDG5498702.1 flagellin [Marinobacter sp. BGYM27]